MLNVIHAVHNEKAGLDVLLHLIDVLIALSLKLAEAHSISIFGFVL